MLEDVIVVQSAISAFNNAALWGAAFFWSALLMTPLFVFVYLFADTIREKLGWKINNVTEKSVPWGMGLVGLWVLLIGGNYAVLRDGATVLPFVLGGILVLSASVVVAFCHDADIKHKKKYRWLLWFVLLMLGIDILFDARDWMEIVVPVGAVALGGGIGRFIGKKNSTISALTIVMMTVVMAVLMQPEFFRFGQLGSLTVLHLLSVILLALALVAVFVLQNFQAENKISRSIYVKIKWLMRVLVLLCGALFLLTEALPVFFCMVALFFVWFVVAVRHQSSISPMLKQQFFALALFLFGVITVMPVISVMGILCWEKDEEQKFLSDIKALL